MVEGLVNLSEIKQNLTNFDEAINLILSLKRYIVVKTKKINLTKSIGRILSKKLITLCDNPPMISLHRWMDMQLKKDIAIKKKFLKLSMNHQQVVQPKKYRMVKL